MSFPNRQYSNIPDNITRLQGFSGVNTDDFPNGYEKGAFHE